MSRVVERLRRLEGSTPAAALRAILIKAGIKPPVRADREWLASIPDAKLSRAIEIQRGMDPDGTAIEESRLRGIDYEELEAMLDGAG